MENLLKNGPLEADWSEERSHRCLVFPLGGTPYDHIKENIFTPPNWLVWYVHLPGLWDEFEGTDAWGSLDRHRAHNYKDGSGVKGYRLFTKNRTHDGGLLQTVYGNFKEGEVLRFTAYAHAWSNHTPIQGHETSAQASGDGRWSFGFGRDKAIFYYEGGLPFVDYEKITPPEKSWYDARDNFTFWLGIDPLGGQNPFADSVAWGKGAHIYNTYALVPACEVIIPQDTDKITIFTRSKTHWDFTNNDAYWDDLCLQRIKEQGAIGDREPPITFYIAGNTGVVRSPAPLSNITLSSENGQYQGIGLTRDTDRWYAWQFDLGDDVTKETKRTLSADDITPRTFGLYALPPSPSPTIEDRGKPRVQYERTYILLPPDAGAEWAKQALAATWDEERTTVGASADDAGIGDLDKRRVLAVNPQNWPDSLPDFFATYYPGVQYIPIEAETPDDLYYRLGGELPSPPPVGELQIGLHDQSGLEWMGANAIKGVALFHTTVEAIPLGLDVSHYTDIYTYLRLGWGYADGRGSIPPQEKLTAWVEAMAETINRARGFAGIIIGNEINNPTEWPGGYPDPSFIISPQYYVEAYNAICSKLSSIKTPIAPAPLDPYNVTAGEFGIASDPRTWASYIYTYATRVDFIALHAKTQGADPETCNDYTEFSHPPLIGRRQNLRTILDQIKWIPSRHVGKPIVITELNPQRKRDGSLGWDYDGAEWVHSALDFIRGIDGVSGAIFYRYTPAGDQAGFGLEGRQDILNAIKEESRRTPP